MDITKYFQNAKENFADWSIDRLRSILRRVESLDICIRIDDSNFGGEHWVDIELPRNTYINSQANWYAVIRYDIPLAIVSDRCEKRVKKILEEENIHILYVPDINIGGYSIDTKILFELDQTLILSEHFNPKNFSINELIYETQA